MRAVLGCGGVLRGQLSPLNLKSERVPLFCCSSSATLSACRCALVRMGRRGGSGIAALSADFFLGR